MNKYKRLSSRMRVKYGNPVGCGASRRAFRFKDWIIKIPINECGIDDNKKEALIYFNYKKGNKPFFVPASCKMTIDKETGLPILFMERLTPVPSEKYPDWVWSLCDGHQVGKSKSGKVKCYDYAMES